MSDFKPMVVLNNDMDGMGSGFVIICNDQGVREVIADKILSEDNAGPDGELADEPDYFANGTRLSANVQAIFTLRELLDAYNVTHGTNY